MEFRNSIFYPHGISLVLRFYKTGWTTPFSNILVEDNQRKLKYFLAFLEINGSAGQEKKMEI